MRRVLAALLFGVALVTPAVADELIGSYAAYFSDQDHVNSKGVTLSSAAQVIAQDRANLHRFNRADVVDEWDSYFTSVARRQGVAAMLDRGQVPAGVRNDILKFRMMAQVEIWQGAYGPYLNVYLLP